jgi:hypothetical protein
MSVFRSASTSKTERRQITWNALTAFCGEDLSFLKGNGINDLANVLTLSPVIHAEFSDLQLAFHEISASTSRPAATRNLSSKQNQRDTYEFVSYDDRMNVYLNRLRRASQSGRAEVIFTDRSGENLSVVSFFHVHYCAIEVDMLVVSQVPCSSTCMRLCALYYMREDELRSSTRLWGSFTGRGSGGSSQHWDRSRIKMILKTPRTVRAPPCEYFKSSWGARLDDRLGLLQSHLPIYYHLQSANRKTTTSILTPSIMVWVPVTLRT